MADCTPETVVAESICFACDSITTKQLLAAILWVEATNAGISTNPQTLVNNSICLACDSITEKQLLAAIVYLKCQALP